MAQRIAGRIGRGTRPKATHSPCVSSLWCATRTLPDTLNKVIFDSRTGRRGRGETSRTQLTAPTSSRLFKYASAPPLRYMSDMARRDGLYRYTFCTSGSKVLEFLSRPIPPPIEFAILSILRVEADVAYSREMIDASKHPLGRKLVITWMVR